MIEVEHLTKFYGDFTAVKDISFSVGEGEILGFLGPNGAGKSTTMNIITGYISPTEGTVKINGYNILEEPNKAKMQIGYLPEQPQLYPNMTVTEYLAFVCGLKKITNKKVNLYLLLYIFFKSTTCGFIKFTLFRDLTFNIFI